MDGRPIESNVPWNRRMRRIAWLLVAIGIILRLVFLAQNRSFWQDEIAVALALENGGNSVSLNFEALEQENQVAPVGFLVLVKACVAVLGEAEWCYRLIPFFASAVGLVLMWRLALACLSPTAGLFAIGIIAMSPRLLDYASELKPYSVDQAIATAILYIAFLAHKAGWNGRHLAILAAFGVVAPWLSFPSMFVLAIVGAALFVMAIRERRWRTVLVAVPMGCAWIASFGVEYQLVKAVAKSDYMLSFWSNQFMPFPPRSWDDLLWVTTSLRSLFTNPLKTSVPVVALVLCLIGWCRYWRQDRFLATLLVGPVLLTMAVSATHLYPFGNRLAQFLIPALSIGLALGFELILNVREHWQRRVGFALVVLCLAEPTGWIAKHAVVGRVKESPRRVLRHVAENWHDGDLLYRSVYSELSVRYYGPRVGLPKMEWFRGHNVLFESDETALETLGNSRVWFYFGHAREHDVQAFVAELDRRGIQLDAIPCQGSSAYLYDMRTRIVTQDEPSRTQ